ncbi:LisH domain-containing protein [Aphis craccivora]|uniref:LisH domain-containing protein n=1 Tax=Aphis craccivora TaxID=307492 RepID=A0A6G0YS45_APHCR|nr:LisH domain-containing protein [Aphis craccivora]
MERQTDAVDAKLHEVVKQSLKDGSNWDSFVSTVETEIRKILENKRVINTTKNKPEQTETIELINKLIFEYMDWMGYKLTNSMFKKELGTELKANSYRKEMISSLDLEDTDETLKLPLLTVLITMFKNKDGDNHES